MTTYTISGAVPAAVTTGSFEEFVHATGNRVLRMALLLCGDEHQAEDLTQTTFAKVFVAWDKVSRADNPIAYTRTILTRTFLSHRRLRRSSELPTDLLPEQVVEPRDESLRMDLLSALAMLSPADRAVLMLRYWEDLSVAQTAEILGIKDVTCRARSSRALTRLRTQPTRPGGHPMTLHDQMDHAVSGTTTDLTRLAAASAAQGVRLRRRRRTARAVLGGAAGVASVAVVLAVLPSSTPAPESGGSGRVPTASEAPASPAPSDPTVALDGRATVALLRASIEEVAPRGTFRGFGGQGGRDPRNESRDTYGELDFAPADGAGAGRVGINVQEGEILAGAPFRCDGSFMVDCTVTTLPNGDRLRTYREPQTPSGDGIRVVAELLTKGDRLRVVAGAENGFSLPSNGWDVTRPDPVLDLEQLSAIVTRDWWGFRAPAEYDGADLAPYEDFDAVWFGDGVPGSSPTSAPDPG